MFFITIVPCTDAEAASDPLKFQGDHWTCLVQHHSTNLEFQLEIVNAELTDMN